jgi:hypothetical protein
MIYIHLDHVDRRLGKGEVVSSILPGSTIKRALKIEASSDFSAAKNIRLECNKV